MLEAYFTVGIFISLLYDEWMDVSPGGLITPAYFALFMDQPMRLVSTGVIALLTVACLRLLSQWIPLYGKRQFAVAVGLAMVIKTVVNGLLAVTVGDLVVLVAIGHIIPGLLANEMEKQGIVRTLLHTAIATIGIYGVLLLFQGLGLGLGVGGDQTSLVQDLTFTKTADLLGLDYSGITTTLGNERAKRTAVNPNFAAVVVDMLDQAGLKRGDPVALNLSGSFPTLNVAAIIAVEEMGLEPMIISSIGASTHGANRPGLTYLDMEDRLHSEGLISSRSLWVSPGGDGDMGTNMDQDLLLDIYHRLTDKGYQIFLAPDLDQNLNMRMDHYQGSKALVNVGGNLISQGSSDLGHFWSYGLIQPTGMLNYTDNGLIGQFLSRDLPVVNMLQIMDIASTYGLAIDPEWIPPVGEGGVYQEVAYPRSRVFFLLLLFGMGVGIHGYQRRKQNKRILIENLHQTLNSGTGSIHHRTGSSQVS